MRTAGWLHDAKTGGFTKRVRNGGVHRRLWVSWGQADDAVRLAEAGEEVVGVVGQSETLARIVNQKPANAA
jgi:hypothetical protein